MNLFSRPSSQLSSDFVAFTRHSTSQNFANQITNEKNGKSPASTSRILFFQKPKHLWMAKDLSLSTVSNCSEMNNDESNTCSVTSLGNEQRITYDHVYGPQPNSESTPLRGGYNGASPSNSSSAPGTFAIPSSLTNTSSSPSNHPSPVNRFGVSVVNGTQCESPSISYQPSSSRSRHSYESKPKRKRGRPPKSKSDDSVTPSLPVHIQYKPQVDGSDAESYPVQPPSTSASFFTGGLKIRLRRDVSVEEPICGKKSRSRKSNQKSVQVFRIVESWCDADAPGGLAAKVTANSPMSANQTSGGFKVGDVVWAKLAGYPYWPSKISALYARTPHQLAQVNPANANGDSLAVTATPADPALAPGFTAKVEWFAWSQCSYLSCAKLFPFREFFDKFYNPRTRVKNYAEAVNMARRDVDGSSTQTQLDTGSISKAQKSLLNDIENRPSNTASLSSGLNFFNSLSEPRQSLSVDANSPLPFDNLNLHGSTLENPVESCNSSHFPFFNLTANPVAFDQIAEQAWEPLPQLDVSGLNEFNSGVPTFSDDEDDVSATLSSQLRSELGPLLK